MELPKAVNVYCPLPRHAYAILSALSDRATISGYSIELVFEDISHRTLLDIMSGSMTTFTIFIEQFGFGAGVCDVDRLAPGSNDNGVSKECTS